MHIHASPPGILGAIVYQTIRTASLRAKRSNLSRPRMRKLKWDCFAEFILGLAEGETRGLAMTLKLA
jgi:hypothetical protein